MNKIMKIKLLVFSGILLVASICYVLHWLPYTAIWLWAPILVFVDYYLDGYAKRSGMVLYDEMAEQTTEKSAWVTFQATIVVAFLMIVYYDLRRTQIDPRYTLAYLVGFMGIVFLVVSTYYNIKQGVYE